jgi:hypothetical protein
MSEGNIRKSEGIFSPAATAAQLKPLADLPLEQGGIGVVVDNGDVGVAGAVNKQLGKKGWFVQGEGSWMSRTGYRVMGWFGWKKRDS